MSQVLDNEECGRGVWDSSKAKDPTNARIFREKFGELRASIDRLDLADLASLTDLHDKARGGGRFKGWHVLTAEQIRSANCEVVEDPLLDNPWHANIVFPDITKIDEDEWKQVSHTLATMAHWRPK